MQEDFSDPQVLAAERGDPDPRDQPLTPVERLRVWLIQEDHAEDAEAFALVDDLMRTYITEEPLTKGAEELRDMLFDVLDSWTVANLK